MAEPSKQHGQYNSAMGNAKQAVGGAIEATYSAAGGSTEPSSFTTAGKEQHAKGEAEIKSAEGQQFAEGVGDRVEGKMDSVVGSVTGDRSKQAQGNIQHDKGKFQMEANS